MNYQPPMLRVRLTRSIKIYMKNNPNYQFHLFKIICKADSHKIIIHILE